MYKDKEKQKAWYAANRERTRASHRKSHWKNRDSELERMMVHRNVVRGPRAAAIVGRLVATFEKLPSDEHRRVFALALLRVASRRPDIADAVKDRVFDYHYIGVYAGV